MGYTAPTNLKITRGKLRSGLYTHWVAAGDTRYETVNFTGLLWGALFRFHPKANSHLSWFQLRIDDNYIAPSQQTFLNIDLYKGYTTEHAKLEEYNVDGMCVFTFWFPTGMRVDEAIELNTYNGCAALNLRNAIFWIEEDEEMV